MPEKAVISISLPRGLRVPGAQIAGLLDLNVALAQEKNVEMVKLSLKGCLTTYVTSAFFIAILPTCVFDLVGSLFEATTAQRSTRRDKLSFPTRRP